MLHTTCILGSTPHLRYWLISGSRRRRQLDSRSGISPFKNHQKMGAPPTGPTEKDDLWRTFNKGHCCRKVDCSGFGMLILLMFFELITIDLSEFSETVCFQVVCLRVEEDCFFFFRRDSQCCSRKCHPNSRKKMVRALAELDRFL